jgi:hypothetical protein
MSKNEEEIKFQNLSREDCLKRLMPGDIFRAEHHDGGGHPPCLVVAVNENSIIAHAITTQEPYVFERGTGVTLPDKSWAGATIRSVEPLPLDIHNVLLELERKCRLGNRSVTSIKLTEQQKKALLFASRHYKEYPI